MVKKMRKETVKHCLFYLALTFILCTCNDPVFYAISQEVKPIPPRIKGVPTNFAILEERMFVASGQTLHTYNKGEEKPFWLKETAPGGNILNIASTYTGAGGYLYALCATDNNNDGKTVIRRFNKDDSSWTDIGGTENYSKIHDIFAAGDILFALATSPSTTFYNLYFSILYIDNSYPDKASELFIAGTEQKDLGEINGAAYDGVNYYLTARNTGVYKIANVNTGAVLLTYTDESGNEANNFSGIINLKDTNNTILTVSRKGEIFIVKDAITKVENISMGKMASGALAIYEKPPEPGEAPSANPERLLLAGRQDSLVYTSSSGYTYGYLEIELDTNGIKEGKSFIEPGNEQPSSVRPEGNERFQSTIGKYPINYLFQAPFEIDSNMTLFAATQKNGVWSYRMRDPNQLYQWNAEGEDEPKY